MLAITINTNDPIHAPGYSAVRCVLTGLAIGQGQAADHAILTASNITYALHTTDELTETIGNTTLTITKVPQGEARRIAATSAVL